MSGLRKGDLWKAIVLGLLIVGAGAFIYHTLRAAARPTVAAQSPQQAEPGSSAEGAKNGSRGQTGEKLFARRPRTPAADMARVRAAPDPFRPYVSEQALAASGSERAPGEGASALGAARPGLGGLRLTGIISDTHQPLVALRQGRRHYYVRLGGTIPGGWRLVEVGTRTVTLAKGGERVEIGLASASREATQ